MARAGATRRLERLAAGALHLIVNAPGHRTLVTELFDAEDPYLDSDAVLGVRETLVGHYEDVVDAAACALLGVPGPICPVMTVVLRLAPLGA